MTRQRPKAGQKEHTEQAPQKKKNGKIFAGMVFCCTGTLSQARSVIEQLITKAGGTCQRSLTGKCHVLVKGKRVGRNKTDKAARMRIKTWGEKKLMMEIAKGATDETQEQVSTDNEALSERTEGNETSADEADSEMQLPEDVNWTEKGAKTKADKAKIATCALRAFWATYSGPFKNTPLYRADPVNALPFQGRGWMSQKMDGMFMLWDGKKQMYNRGRGGAGDMSHSQNPPASFYKHLPQGVELEGELCYASGEYSRGRAAQSKGWKNACLFVWDAPLVNGTYKQRWAFLTKLLSNFDSQYVRPVPFLGIAKSRRALDATLVKVRSTLVACKFGTGGMVGASYQGGEGVMVRDPDAPYTFACFESRRKGHKKGQTSSLYKYLEEYGNDECKVLAFPDDQEQEEEASQGRRKSKRHKGGGGGEPVNRRDRKNSLYVMLPNGTEFVLSSLSCLGVKAADVEVGSVITFTYRGWADGLPLSASAQAFRTDRTWEDIVANFIPPPPLACGLVRGPVHRQKSVEHIIADADEAD